MSFVGEASEEGTFKLLHKGRGLAKSIGLMIDDMKKAGYKGGKVIISHALNELGAIKVKENILKAAELNRICKKEFYDVCRVILVDGSVFRTRDLMK